MDNKENKMMFWNKQLLESNNRLVKENEHLTLQLEMANDLINTMRDDMPMIDYNSECSAEDAIKKIYSIIKEMR